MVRFTMLALLATLAATDGRVLAPETSAELVSAFTTVRSGDTIKLKSTAYTIDQQLSMTKVFGVKVEGARDGTVIKASKKTRVLYLYQTQSLSFKGVVFANGRVDAASPVNASGAGALISQSTGVVFDGGCGFVNNVASGSGGGVAVFESTAVSFDEVAFTGNSAQNGGGLYTVNSDKTNIANSEFVGNTASLGGGLYVEGGDDSALMASSFTANKAQSVGAAVLLVSTAGFRVGGTLFESNLLQGDESPAAMPMYVVDSNVVYTDRKAEQTVEMTCGQQSVLSDAASRKRSSGTDNSGAKGRTAANMYEADAIATVRIFAIAIEGLPENMDNETQLLVRATGVFGSAEVTGATNGSSNASLACLLDPKISGLHPEVLLEAWAMESGRKLVMIGKASAPIGNNTSGQDKYLLEGVRKIRFAYITISWYIEPQSGSNSLRLAAASDDDAFIPSGRGGRVPSVGVVCLALLAVLAVVAAVKQYAGRRDVRGTMQ